MVRGIAEIEAGFISYIEAKVRQRRFMKYYLPLLECEFICNAWEYKYGTLYRRLYHSGLNTVNIAKKPWPYILRDNFLAYSMLWRPYQSSDTTTEESKIVLELSV
jgi:hypothetical protein